MLRERLGGQGTDPAGRRLAQVRGRECPSEPAVIRQTPDPQTSQAPTGGQAQGRPPSAAPAAPGPARGWWHLSPPWETSPQGPTPQGFAPPQNVRPKGQPRVPRPRTPLGDTGHRGEPGPGQPAPPPNIPGSHRKRAGGRGPDPGCFGRRSPRCPQPGRLIPSLHPKGHPKGRHSQGATRTEPGWQAGTGCDGGASRARPRPVGAVSWAGRPCPRGAQRKGPGCSLGACSPAAHRGPGPGQPTARPRRAGPWRSPGCQGPLSARRGRG